MTYEEAVNRLKAGEKVSRGGRTLRMTQRGVFDVTDPENAEHVYLTEGDRKAADWEAVAS